MLCCLFHTFCTGVHAIRHSCTVGRSPSLESLSVPTVALLSLPVVPRAAAQRRLRCSDRAWGEARSRSAWPGGSARSHPSEGASLRALVGVLAGRRVQELFADVQRHVFKHLALPAAWTNPCQAPAVLLFNVLRKFVFG